MLQSYLLRKSPEVPPATAAIPRPAAVLITSFPVTISTAKFVRAAIVYRLLAARPEHSAPISLRIAQQAALEISVT